MPDPERKAALKPDLHIVPNVPACRLDIASAISSLVGALAEIHMQDAELRQLWLETHWLKADHEHGVLSLPTNWEMMILAIARGEVSPGVQRYPKVVQAASDLGNAIKQHLKSL